MLAIVATAKAFGQRPSELVGIEDPVVALNFDMAAVVRLNEELHHGDAEGTEKVYL
jgi:hypothetical protein